MKPRSAATFILFAAWGVSQYLLLSGSPVLTEPLPFFRTVPAGTLITWGGFVAIPAAVLLARPQWLGHVGIRAMQVVLILASAWGFVSYGLADNWSFNFGTGADRFRGSSAAGRLFWFYSLTVWALPLLVVSGAAVYRLFSKLRR